MSGFQWTDRTTSAALALAEGKTQTVVAAACDISTRTIRRWLADPEFSAEVDRLTLITGIATRAERLRIAQRVARQRTQADGAIDTKADILDWLKFAQSETDGSKSDIADKLAALYADHAAASAHAPAEPDGDDTAA